MKPAAAGQASYGPGTSNTATQSDSSPWPGPPAGLHKLRSGGFQASGTFGSTRTGPGWTVSEHGLLPVSQSLPVHASRPGILKTRGACQWHCQLVRARARARHQCPSLPRPAATRESAARYRHGPGPGHRAAQARLHGQRPPASAPPERSASDSEHSEPGGASEPGPWARAGLAGEPPSQDPSEFPARAAVTPELTDFANPTVSLALVTATVRAP